MGKSLPSFPYLGGRGDAGRSDYEGEEQHASIQDRVWRLGIRQPETGVVARLSVKGHKLMGRFCGERSERIIQIMLSIFHKYNILVRKKFCIEFRTGQGPLQLTLGHVFIPD